MRKFRIIFLGLVIVTLIGVCYIGSGLFTARDNVQIQENVIYGDKSIVEGVTIESDITYENRIFWDTTYCVGQMPQCKTDYQFSGSPIYTSREYIHGLYAYIDSKIILNEVKDAIDNIENVGKTQGLELSELQKQYQNLFMDLENRKYASTFVYLKDYMEYYQFKISLYFPKKVHFSLSKEQLKETLGQTNLSPKLREQLEHYEVVYEAFHKFLKIPVLSEQMYEVHIGKIVGNKSGTSGLNGVEDKDAFDMFLSSVYTNGTCYFSFDNRTTHGNIVDTSLIHGGYGIYAFSYNTETQRVDTQSFQMVYPLEVTESVVHMVVNEKDNSLLLFTEDEEHCYLTVLDIDSMEMRQKFAYASYNSEDVTRCYWIYDDFLVAQYAWEEAALISFDKEGTYTYEFSIDIAEEGKPQPTESFNGGYAFDWNGTKLLMCGELMDTFDYNSLCGTFLTVYDKTGMIYYGTYENSLDTGISDEYGFLCNLKELEVNWE